MSRFAPVRLALGAVALAGTSLHAQSALPDSLTRRIDGVFAAWDHTSTPGCALGIAQGGRTVYERGYGMSDLQHAIAITPRSIFHVASVSKQFTAFAVALLAEDGKLSLDDDVRRFIPELPEYPTRITVRQLMHHVSGLRDQWQLLGMAGWRFPEDLITEDDVLGIVRRQKALNFAPQSEYAYSNTGFTLLGVIVKRVSGESLRAFAERRIFAPLGMTHTHFHDDHTMIVPDRTSAYEPRPGGGWKISIPVFDTYGATSLFTTPGDLLKWTANLDQPVVGSARTIADAQVSGVLSDGTSIGYGYGMTLQTYRGLRAVGHGGADAGYRAHLERYPERGLALAVACNASTSGPQGLLRRVADVLLGASAPPVVPPVDTVPRVVGAEVLARFAGTWHDTLGHGVVRVRLSGDTLRLGTGERLIPTSDTSVRIAGQGAALVLRTAGGAVTGLRALPVGTRAVVFRRETPVTATPALLAAHAGSYYSDELDVRYVLVPRDDVLALEHRKLRNVTLTPAFADAFTTSFGATALFTRDAKGQITGFTLSDGRVRGVRFDREAARR
ncbi:MAG: beta-lactamase family protein [Gemmatimonadetes bacterium]|nr:beta-lactamase family protein [Gemmatimonadota bacterium]